MSIPKSKYFHLHSVNNRFMLKSMNAKDTARLIEATGGNKAFAVQLGIDRDPTYQQRVYQWKQRGLSSKFFMQHQNTIKRLARKYGVRIVLVP